MNARVAHSLPLALAVWGLSLHFAVGALPARNDGRSWPTLHGDLMRSGYYPEFPRGPLRLAWRKTLHQELTGTRAETIVADDLAFIGTYAGKVYAWDAATGEERWVFQTGGPVMHSPMFHDKTLYVASMDRGLYALETAGGGMKWRFNATAGFWSSPVVFNGKVLLGSRDGIFHAIAAETGLPVWQFQTADRILTPASVSSDGKQVVFASEDMHAYSLDFNTGELLWKSRKMQGLSVRDHAPVLVGGVALFTTNPVRDFHDVLDRHQQLFLDLAGHEDQLESVGNQRRYIPYSEEGFRREQAAFLRYLKERPEDQTFHAFSLADGIEPWVAPVPYTAGLHNPPTPPCYHPRTGEVYLYTRSAYGVWDGGGEVRPYTGVGRLEVRTGRVDLVHHGYRSSDPARGPGRKDMPWGVFWSIGDETQTLSLSDFELFSNHQGSLGAMRFDTGLCRNLFGKRDTYGGFYGPGTFGWGEAGETRARQAGEPFGLVNEWHGPCKAMASVANGRVYYHVGSQILCLEAAP